MNTMIFTIFIAVFILLDFTWGFITPTWVMVATVFFYIVLATAEFRLDIKAKEVWGWVSRFNSGRW